MGIKKTVRPGYRQTKRGYGGEEGSASLHRAETARLPGMGKPMMTGDLASGDGSRT